MRITRGNESALLSAWVGTVDATVDSDVPLHGIGRCKGKAASVPEPLVPGEGVSAAPLPGLDRIGSAKPGRGRAPASPPPGHYVPGRPGDRIGFERVVSRSVVGSTQSDPQLQRATKAGGC